MKRLLLALATCAFSVSSVVASPYFRWIDPSHLHTGAGFLISPRTPKSSAGVTDLALITHKANEGTIIPDAWQAIIPPESWVPLQAGLGGSFNGEAVAGLGTSANVAPIFASLLLRGVNSSSSGWAQALKTALLGRENGGGFRLGGALAGVMVREGHFRSIKAAFPGCGVGEIISNSAHIDVGWAWNF